MEMVIAKLVEFHLKLKYSKCQFIQQEVSYLGHVITPCGLKTSEEHVQAVMEFATPGDVHAVRRFLGLASYYRRLVPLFAKLAHPLHALTRKGAVFDWDSNCQKAFDNLKQKLTEASVLAYPQFDRNLYWRQMPVE